MRVPPLHTNEHERVSALQNSGLLDSGPEERFDRITRTASRLFDVPIALVSLIDDHRQWFKSRVGLDAAQTPREVSFCGHAILDQKVLTVEDTQAAPRFADNPLVVDGPKIRFYAGCPLHDEHGNAFGTLCIIDSKPRRFGVDEKAALSDLARVVEREIKNVA